jgi:hypothetical protein
VRQSSPEQQVDVSQREPTGTQDVTASEAEEVASSKEEPSSEEGSDEQPTRATKKSDERAMIVFMVTP